MHSNGAIVAAPPRPPAVLVARLRMMLADGVMTPGIPYAICHVARLLKTDADVALDVLMELGRDGFLERTDDTTIRVCTQEESRSSDVLEVRRLLEPAAVRWAASHVRPVDLITLRQQACRVDESVAAHDFDAFRRCDDALITSLLSLHPNDELLRLIADLRVKTPYDGLRDAFAFGVCADSLHAHGRLLDLVEAHKVDAVEALVRQSLAALRFVGAPVMDAPFLHGLPAGRDGQPDGEFLEAPLA